MKKDVKIICRLSCFELEVSYVNRKISRASGSFRDPEWFLRVQIAIQMSNRRCASRARGEDVSGRQGRNNVRCIVEARALALSKRMPAGTRKPANVESDWLE